MGDVNAALGVSKKGGGGLGPLPFKMMIHPSHYLRAYLCSRQPGRLILFSTQNASTILIEKETFDAMENSALSPSAEKQLLKLKMITPDKAAEKKAIFNLVDDLNPKNTGLKITAVLNLDCNFACIYCFEESVKNRQYMTEQTADHLKRFIKDKFTPDKQMLVVDFYGGEPLLSLDLIRSISRDLKAFTKSRNASYGFSLVTNGSLFTRKTAEELIPLGLQNVKITIDGPAITHNRSRPFKSGAGSFNVIANNIKATCDLLKIGLGGNFEKQNYKKFPELLDNLKDEGISPDKLYTVKFDPVVNRPENDISPTDFTDGCMTLYEPWLYEAEAFLREEILKRGYNTPKPRPMVCMIETEDSYVVGVDGTLYKCPGFIGQKGFEAGNITTGVIDYSDAYHLGIWKNPECAECVYLPLCFGGCRYMSYVRDGHIDAVDCRKAYYDAALEMLIKQDIWYRQGMDCR
ncbi:geopeptide radical SAM maturase [Thermodesulfobacteriota bacterium]